jgi:hypothetical protein
MKLRNPARSGTTDDSVCWMINSKDDFYHDEYRSVKGQVEIFELALEMFPSLREAAKTPTTKWLRNIKLYLGAHTHA